MQNFTRNVSKTCVRNQFLWKPANYLAHRNASNHLNAHKSHVFQRPQHLSPLCLHVRCYSIESDDPPPKDSKKYDRKLPKISDEGLQFGASLFSFLASHFKAFMIRSKYDRDFSLSEFTEGSKKAVEIVSDKLASADFDGLRGLVTDDLIDDLRDKINAMTDEQRQELRAAPNDICQAMVNHVDVKEENDALQVTITMVYHIVRGFVDLKEGRIPPENIIQNSAEFLDDNFFVLNYKFTKEFSEGNNDDWIITFINHASIRDEMNEQTKGFNDMLQKLREKNQKK